MTTRWQFGQPWARLAAGLIPAFVLAVLLTNGSVSMAIRVEAALVLIVTLIRPAIGLMIVAFLAPLGDIVVPIFGGPPLRHAETLTVAFLAGWLLFRTDHDESPRGIAGDADQRHVGIRGRPDRIGCVDGPAALPGKPRGPAEYVSRR